MNTNETPALPLFAQLLEQSETQVENGGTAPTYHCGDFNCTKKYPSDNDDSDRYSW